MVVKSADGVQVIAGDRPLREVEGGSPDGIAPSGLRRPGHGQGVQNPGVALPAVKLPLRRQHGGVGVNPAGIGAVPGGNLPNRFRPETRFPALGKSLHQLSVQVVKIPQAADRLELLVQALRQLGGAPLQGLRHIGLGNVPLDSKQHGPKKSQRQDNQPQKHENQLGAHGKRVFSSHGSALTFPEAPPQPGRLLWFP